ncbi:DNA cytosine methyltransferase [Rhizobium johnstonii]|uniref:DNA cytosine methyltransferase n=1 Tax=Rhizobium johnstonii TaxID=3019933 RepID=UPI002DDD1501|nr:DNA cytosine methyltransferase [Rhizobium johnstonii]
MEKQQDHRIPETDASSALQVTGERIQKYKKKQIEYFLKVTKEVADLKNDFPALRSEELTSWLRKEMRFSADEAEVFASCPPDVAENAKLLEDADISLDTIREIVGADRKTRSDCFIRIARGDRVDKDVVEGVRRAVAAAALSAEDIEQQRRLEAFCRASAEIGVDAISRLEREASELLILIEEAAAELEGGAEPKGVLDSRRTVLRERAATLLQSVESLFGSSHPPRDREGQIVRQGPVAASISYSWYALRDLAEGMIEIRDLFTSDDVGWKGVRKCVEFLAGRRPSAVSHASSMNTPLAVPTKPTFVDIDAGVGGTSLGLLSAGFLAAAVYVRDADARRTMRKNKPSWDVRKLVDDDLTMELADLAEKKIDLLTCGLPWHHYSRIDARAAAQNAETAVRILRPKVFMFESASEEYDGAASRPFEDLGYDVRWHSVDVSRFGIAQAKSRSVIVGARDGCLATLSMPVVDPPYQQTLSEAIGDLVAGYVWNGTEDKTARLRHATEVSKWLDDCNGPFRLAPEMPSPGRRLRKKDWLQRGIDIEGYTNRPPTLEDFESGKGFRLTTEMLKQIQKFPWEWLVENEKSNAPQVASAFPPVAAKMLGLAIHSALTGAEFDYRRSVTTRLLSPKRVMVRRGEPVECMPFSVSELRSDPNRIFRISAVAQRREQQRREMSSSTPRSDEDLTVSAK